MGGIESDEGTIGDRPSWWSRLASWTVQTRSDLALGVLDAVLFAVAYVTVLVVRFDGSVPSSVWGSVLPWLPFGIAVGVGAMWLWGLYGQVWRHASANEARRLLGAVTSTLLVLSGFEIAREPDIPWTMVIFGTGLAGFLLGAVRFQSRLFSFHRDADTGGRPPSRVVVIGAKDAGAALISEMFRSPGAGLVPVAVIDPDPSLHGRRVSTLPVTGGFDAIPETIEATRADQIVLAMSSPPSATVREIAVTAERCEVTLRVVGGLSGRMQASLRQIRDLQIDDLIGREQVTTDLDAVRAMIRGRRVLVTGAGGSIGSELVRQIAGLGPSVLVALDHDESHLHEVAARINPIVESLADVRDRVAVQHVFDRHRPEVVFHAAAHKHVPLLEEHAAEAVLTNVIGTQNVLDACADIGVERFVFVSTDKAVRPSSVMGASKRIGESQVLGHRTPGTTYTAVRFGNVLGSRGSVVPTFTRQIETGGPVTVTDDRMTRYFMSIAEAVQLILQAATLSQGSDLFVLDMGEPVRIRDLAERMIRLSGHRVGDDIEVRVVGTRPGEKFVEELLDVDDPVQPTVHPSISRVRASIPGTNALGRAIGQLSTLAMERRDDDVREALFAAVQSLYADPSVHSTEPSA